MTDAMPGIITLPDSLDEIQNEFHQRRWTDGLPIIPPTPQRVRHMLDGSSLPADHVVCEMPPSNGCVTTEAIAINAVMAGCLPAYMPVLVAAVQAVMQDAFCLPAVQASTFPMSVMTMVNGPIAAELDINGGAGAMGPGWRANATIGRALRLILINCGGAVPGVISKSTYGHPAKFTFCFAENEAASPWEPYHVELGHGASESTVTVAAVTGPNNINDHVSTTGEGILRTVCNNIAVPGHNQAYFRDVNLFIGICPDHAHLLQRDGFTKTYIKRYIYEHARIPLRKLRGGGMWGDIRPRPRWLARDDDDAMLPMAERWEDIRIFVIGGEGGHSCWMPSTTNSRSTYAVIKR